MRPILTVLFVILGLLQAQAQVVELIVEPDLWATGEITASIAQYRQDVARQGYDSILTTQPFASPEELRAHLANRYNTTGLDSVVLVGDIPSAIYEMTEWYWDPTVLPDGGWIDGGCNMRGLLAYQADRFYTDLDGVWENNVEPMWSDRCNLGPGNYDFHGGNTAPEISLGRINTLPLVELHPGRTEAQMIVDYFAKNHAYRTGQLRVPMSGILTDPSATADEFKAILGTQWEHLIVTAHGSIQVDRLTWFSVPPDPPDLPTHFQNYELAEADPQGLFVNLATQWTARDCGTTMWWYPSDTPGFFAGEMVFGEGNVLLAAASQARASMTQGLDEFYGPLMEGETFGEALRQYLIAAEGMPWHVIADIFAKEMIYGLTIIGDPLLQDQSFMPLPGDANLDGAVNLADNIILAANWNQSPRGWGEGDFNCDSVVNLADLIIMAGNWGATGSQVPEPGTLLLISAGAAIMTLKRYPTRRRSQ